MTPPVTSTRGRYLAGPLELDLDAHRVTVDGVPIAVSRIEMRLLTDLVTHGGRARTRAELLTHVWGYSATTNTRAPIIHVARLRAKLGEAGGLIETVYGVGYRFSARYPVEHRRA